MVLMLLGLLALLAAVAALLLWRRGTKNQNRLCRRCRYNLGGTPYAMECPECGADLLAPNAVQVGGRLRSPRLRAAACALLLIGGALIAASQHSRLAAVQWIHYRPTSWLMHDTTSTDPKVVGPALRELLRRYDHGQLSWEDVVLLAEQGFEYLQTGPPSGLWNREFGNFIDLAILLGLFPEDQKRRYLANSAGLYWEGPNQVKRADGKPRPAFHVIMYPYVGDPKRSIDAWVPASFEVQQMSATLDGAPLQVDLKAQPVARFTTSLLSYATASIDLPDDWQGRDLVLRWTIQIIEPSTLAPIEDPWTDERTIRLDGHIKGGARRQDDKAYPDISRF